LDRARENTLKEEEG